MTPRMKIQMNSIHESRSTVLSFASFLAIILLLVALLHTSSIPSKRLAPLLIASPEQQQQRSIHLRDVQDASFSVDINSPIMLNAATVAALPAFELALLKPIFLEVGVLVLFQAVGFPVISKLVSLLPIRRLRLLRVLSPTHLRMVRAGGSRMWKGLLAGYSKTSASKIVNRSKKIIKVFLPHDDEPHHE